MRYPLAVLLLLALTGPASAADVSVPHSFSAGTAAKASDVNDNFNALADAINSLTTRVGKLEGQTLALADVAATYTWHELQVGLGNSNVSAIHYEGTITFSADGTFSFSLNNQEADLGTGGASAPTTKSTTETGSGTWTINKNAVTATLTGGGELTFIGTCADHILVGGLSFTDNASGTPQFDKELIILSRNN